MQERILEFKGLNKKVAVDDGELHDMKNLSSDEYPSLYQRKPRGIYNLPAECMKPISMIQKRSKLGLLGYNYKNELRFFYDGYEISALGTFVEDTHMVAINTKICFFPEKRFFDVIDKSRGSLEVNLSYVQEKSITISDDTGEAKINLTDVLLTGLKEDDVVEVECTVSTDKGNFTYGGDKYVDATNLPRISSKVLGFSTSYLALESSAFQDILATGATTGVVKNLKITRLTPDLKYVIESNNRLWGVSDRDNTIYACKLGDPTNWQYYQGTSMDSYYAEQGSDGEWTGCAAYSNHILFFKEQAIHKCYGSTPSSYQIQTTQCYGLEKGSSKSVAIVNDIVIYKSQMGFMAYEGGNPYPISQKFGSTKFDNVVAGSNGRKYYASIHNTDTGENWIVACDIDKALWHKEDNIRARDFCFFNGNLMFISDYDYEYFKGDTIYVIDADEGIPQEKEISWWVELGPFHEYVEEKKVFSRVDMRIDILPDTVLDFYIKQDNGEWEYIDRRTHEHGLTIREMFIPRRCNQFMIRIEGIGNCRIDSLRRRFRVGTGGAL